MSLLSKLVREPLLHFLFIGAGLFLIFYQVAEPVDNAEPNRIVIYKADVDRLSSQFQRQWKRPPTKQELKGLVDAFVREEVLYREALALGLDKDDVIIRRRLGQKLEFLFKDLAEQSEPDDAELERFLADNPERYTIPGRSSFSHVYFNRDKRGTSARNDALEALAKLNGATGAAESAELGDRFLYQYRFDDQSPAQIARVFGRDFSERLDTVEIGGWHGPIESGYGLHLVRITARTDARRPELDEIRDKLTWDVIAERRQEIDAAFYQELKGRYEVRFDTEIGEQLEGAQASG